MPTLVHPKPYFHSFIPLETYHESSLRLSLGLFLEMFDFLSRLGDILLNHENFGTSETILPFIRIAWNIPCIFFTTIPRTMFWKFLKFPVFLLGFRLLKFRTKAIFYSPMDYPIQGLILCRKGGQNAFPFVFARLLRPGGFLLL